MGQHPSQNTSSSGKNQEKAIMKEMMPFILYAAIPIFLTIVIAMVFGYTHQ